MAADVYFFTKEIIMHMVCYLNLPMGRGGGCAHTLATANNAQLMCAVDLNC